MAEQIVWKVTFMDGSHCFFGHHGLAIASARGTGTVEEVRIKHAVLSVAGREETGFEHERTADLEAAGHRLAIELECLLLDTKDLPTVSRWWDTGMEALVAWQALHEYNGPRLCDS
jgi:hypothetical protein